MAIQGRLVLKSLIFSALLSIIPIMASASPNITAQQKNGSALDARRALAFGKDAFEKGAFAEAVRLLKTAADHFSKSSAESPRAFALSLLGQAQLARGRYADALEAFQAALNLALKAKDSDRAAVIESQLGETFRVLGMIQNARFHSDNAVEKARHSDDPAVLADALNGRGNLHAEEGDYEAAMTAYEEALQSSENLQDMERTALLKINAARTALRAGKDRRGWDLLETGAAAFRGLRDSHQKAYGLIAAGQAAADSNQAGASHPGFAENAFQTAAEVARRVDDPLALSYALGESGKMHQRMGRLDEALAVTRKAVFAAQKSRAAKSLYRWQWQAGRILKDKGDIENAVLAYRLAVHSLQSIRNDLATGCQQGTCMSFRDAVRPVYFELADLLLRQTASMENEARIQKNLREARDTVEKLKAAELQDYFQDECVTNLKTQAMTIDGIAGNAAAVYPVLLPDRTEILLSLPGGLRQFTAPPTEADLTRVVRNFRAKLQTPGSRATRQAGRLYEWLIQPLEATLAANDIRTLVFVPDGPLRTIPLAALHDGKDYLIRRYAVVTTPGLTLTASRALERESARLLLSGLTESVQGFNALPSVEDELRDVQALYAASVLKNETYTVPNLENRLRATPYSVVHIASHGQFDRDLNNTFLLAYDGKLTMDRLQTIMGMSQYRQQPVELLTLSACQTAVGDDRAALGLAGVALKAGARSAVASLWFIDDQATSRLITDFYKQLKNQDLDKAQALRNAQLGLLESGEYRHPAYWAPFLLIGNWK